MAEILKEWLTERLERPIKWEAHEFGEMMKNGFVLASVLLSYKFINDEKHFLIRSSNAAEHIKNNWKYLSEWLRTLDINLNDDDLRCLMEGKGSSLLRLFYQLFLTLDKKDRTDFIKRERKMMTNLVEKPETRFKVDIVKEERESVVDDLSRFLLNEKHFVEWQKIKAKQVKETYEYMKHKYSKVLKNANEKNAPFLKSIPKTPNKEQEKDNKEMEKFSLRYPCTFQNYTYEELLKLDEQAVERQKFLVDTEWARNYMNNLHIKIQDKTESEEFQKQIGNTISGSLWELTVAEEESNLDTELAKKVMKLSQFEKQLCTQLMETKQQTRNLIKNRIQAEKQFSEQREQQFNQYLENVKEQISLEVAEIDFEKRRQNTLHKKLYAEKMKRKRQHYYEICYDTMLSIVDYVTKYAYFKLLIGDEIPHHFIHEWKNLYYKHQPIFDILDPMEDILKVEHEDPQYEEVVRLELDRQNALNDVEFKEYHDYSHPWNLECLISNYDPEADDRKYEYLGTRILGHVVYSLLEIKYPYPPQKTPADLPAYLAKAVLRGLPDRSLTVAMQTLLNFRKIQVVRLESAINFCMRKYKFEMVGCTDVELCYDKFISGIPDEDIQNKELIRLTKIEDEVENKSNEVAVATMLGTIPANTKQTQTPKAIPEEEIKLSTAAELGRYAYDTLSSGSWLTDYLLSAMIVEYLKSLNVDGFVIINYPNSYREARILEETFSGRAPPHESELNDNDDIYLEENIAKHQIKDNDPFTLLRSSNLVNNPHKLPNEKPFQSYFTCYIKLKETENILHENFVWDLILENSEFIDRFYSAMGINYSMYYEIIEKDLLAQICKYIIGDLEIPIKSCDKLFGEGILSLLEFPSSEDKRTKSKVVKPEVSNGKSKEKIRRGSKSSKMSITKELQVVKSPSSQEECTEDVFPVAATASEENEKISVISPEEVKVIAGEEEWDYAQLPIVDTIGVALASCWEEIEKTYIYDIKQLLFSKRLQMNCLVPYSRFVKDKMEQIITLPSHKQDLVMKFQKDYNDFEIDWQNIGLTKNEWHCRVKELQNKLYHICDVRKLYAEQQRQLLLSDNWTMEELTTMVNTYISFMQMELNRSMLTFQIFHDFYYAMLKKPLPSDRLSSKDLTKITRDTDDGSGKKGGEDKIYKQLKANHQEMLSKNIQIDYSNNPFNLIIENNVKFAMKIVKDTNDSYRSLISKEYNEIAKASQAPKKKEGNNSEMSISSEEIFKENALKCIDEWTMGINGEMFRFNLRLTTLQNKCHQDMKLFNDHIYKTFTEIQNDINKYYLGEIKSVDRLCKYLQMAIENGRKVPESLTLEHDTFVIDHNLIQFANLDMLTEKEEIEIVFGEMDFKVGQLARLRSQFKLVAPTGIVFQQAFIYLLQDFLLFGKESCDGPILPPLWNRLDPEQIPKLVMLIYGDTVHVDWRDFLIYCLNIKFPSVEELLRIRKHFRCADNESTELLDRDSFLKSEFWFDIDFDLEDPHAILRLNLIKHYLFELFETSENLMNYPAFLLAFCKSADPIEGFAMAISMAVGKKVCYKLEDCQDVICKLIEQKKYKDECLACAHKCTEQFLTTLLTKVVNICEGTTIEEIQFTEPSLSDKKGKKTKVAKAKKIESAQSARVPRSQKNLVSQSKLAQSTIDIKTTFICPPCQEDVEVIEEKTPEIKEEEEVELKPEPLEDPNITYAVNQSVIWNVLQICLPWHFKLMPEKMVNPNIEQVNDLFKKLETDTDNGDIYISKFVSDTKICKLLHKVKKFTFVNLTDSIRNVI
ncbi:sperm flagellar protein 2 [Bombyx mori]|uniref:Calponin-homology (CH) domain-containing protein n=1 Tax=Bombyx mori TaxID=7091 RepID=A0A8R2HNH6_BOMMO|nr:sperm flagellar protein 2-like [Bombyx mori]